MKKRLKNQDTMLTFPPEASLDFLWRLLPQQTIRAIAHIICHQCNRFGGYPCKE